VYSAAAEAGVSPQTVYEWIRRGWLVANRPSDSWRVDPVALRRLIALRAAAETIGMRPSTLARVAEFSIATIDEQVSSC
jgi:hypothetical protein